MGRWIFSAAAAACLAAALAAGGADIAELAREHARMLEQQDDPPSMAILVSFSIPPASLAQLARDAAAADVPLVLNGLHRSSMQETAQRIRQIDPQRAAVWSIDPRLFELHAAQAVPLFAVAAGGMRIAVRGEVPLAHALEQLGKQPGAAGAHARSVHAKLAGLAQ